MNAISTHDPAELRQALKSVETAYADNAAAYDRAAAVHGPNECQYRELANVYGAIARTLAQLTQEYFPCTASPPTSSPNP